jgi:hypothetical protein
LFAYRDRKFVGCLCTFFVPLHPCGPDRTAGFPAPATAVLVSSIGVLKLIASEAERVQVLDFSRYRTVAADRSQRHCRSGTLCLHVAVANEHHLECGAFAQAALTALRISRSAVQSETVACRPVQVIPVMPW